MPELSLGVVSRLGIAQLIGWGVTFYLPGAFAQALADDLGWSRALAFSGLSLAMVVMGLVSPVSGRLIQRYGGRRIMAAGASLNALGCAVLACSHSEFSYFGAWMLLGVGMRLSLYDAAFATLVGLAGDGASRAMLQITLLGGLASTVFWPLGAALVGALGWRAGVWVYAAMALLSALLLLGLPDSEGQRTAEPVALFTAVRGSGAQRQVAALYALGVMLIGFLAAGISAHLPGLLAGLGVSVSLAALWGVGQLCARLADLLFGQRLSALGLNVLVGIGLPLCFALALLGGRSPGWAAAFVFCYGAVNGLAARVRASLPLLLFEHRHYASRTGDLLLPSFLLAASAPWLYAVLRQAYGDEATLLISMAVGLLVFATAAALLLRVDKKTG